MSRPDDLSVIAATVAHELVAPLAIIASGARLLRRTDGEERDPEESDEIIAAIERNVATAQIVVEALRTLDVEGGDLELARRPVAIIELVETTLRDLGQTILRDHPSAVLAPDEEIEVLADPPRVRQVLFNLLSNAAKYSPPGRDIIVEIRGGTDAAQVVVRDRGHGIAPDDAERIFEKWERADEGTSGLGLGLHLSRAIARAHGGELGLEDAPDDEGARFVLTLPLPGGSSRGLGGPPRR